MLLAAKLALPVMIVAIAVPPALVSLLAWATHPGPEQERWPGRPQLNKVSGVPATPFITSDRIDQLQNGTFKPSSKDIWVATYPKTGTTWTQTIVNHINGFAPLERGQYPFTYCPWPEVSLGLPPLRYSIEEINDFKRWEGPVGGWRCLKSHWHYADHMADAGKRVIYVMRNVLDVATSFYHHSRRFHFVYLDMADVSFDAFFEMLKAGNVDNGDYFDHVASWWAVKDRPNVLFVRYEDLLADPAAVIRRIAAHMGVELTDAFVAQIVELSSFRRMKQFYGGDVGEIVLTAVGALRGPFFRRGELGTYRESVNAEQRAWAIEQYLRKLAPLGVPRDWVIPAAAVGEPG